MFIRSQAAAAAPVVPSYTALSQLPTTGLTIGQRAIVRFGTPVTNIAEFSAISATEWLCVSGTTNNLYSANLNVPQSPRSAWVATTYTIDPRFPYHMFLFSIRQGGVTRRDSFWYSVSTTDLLALPAAIAGRSRTDANSLVFISHATASGDVVIGLGRTSANVLLATTHEGQEDFMPLTVRGSS